MALSLKYLVERRGLSGKVVKTVSTTQMINRLARKYGLEVIETPVGFDHIAEWMLRDRVLIGGEESGGMSFQGHIPEGDGVLMGLLVLEMVAATGRPLEELVQDLLEEVGPSNYGRMDLRLARPVSKQEMVERLAQQAPAQIAGNRVEQVLTNDGIKYMLQGDAWLLIRPSGTEPVLRVYAEANNRQDLEGLLEHGRAVAQAA
jgi:phosphomannomutase